MAIALSTRSWRPMGPERGTFCSFATICPVQGGKHTGSGKDNAGGVMPQSALKSSLCKPSQCIQSIIELPRPPCVALLALQIVISLGVPHIHMHAGES